MATYQIPQTAPAPTANPNEAFLVASGDLRLSANQTCWPAQADMEQKIIAAFSAEGITVKRAHPYDEALKHGVQLYPGVLESLTVWAEKFGIDMPAPIE